jgi:hypothetical protein
LKKTQQIIILSLPNTPASAANELLKHLRNFKIKGYTFLVINQELHSISKKELLEILEEASAVE